MSGYLKVKPETHITELRALTLDDCEYIEDEEYFFPEFKNLIGRKHACPRCNAITRQTTNDPYCPDCNWDSLVDPYLERNL